MKTKLLWVALLASGALIGQAQGDGYHGGGRGMGGGFGGGGRVGGGGGRAGPVGGGGGFRGGGFHAAAPLFGGVRRSFGVGARGGGVGFGMPRYSSFGARPLYRRPVYYNGRAAILWNLQMGCAEFSGLNATPLDAGGTNTGTGTAHTTGSLATSVPGMIFYSASELSSSNFTRTISDTTVRNDQTGASQYTGVIQFKIISASPNTLTDSTGADSSNWSVAYAKYKTS